MPTKQEDLPGTLKRSPKKAQRTYERAKKAGVKGRSNMSKTELADAIARKQG
jgi:hypothetical protein